MNILDDYIQTYGGELRWDPTRGTVTGYSERLSKYFADVPLEGINSAEDLHKRIKASVTGEGEAGNGKGSAPNG